MDFLGLSLGGLSIFALHLVLSSLCFRFTSLHLRFLRSAGVMNSGLAKMDCIQWLRDHEGHCYT